MKSEISIASYINEYSLFFPNGELFAHQDNYIPQFVFLKKKAAETVTIDKDVLCFIDVLQICSDNIKRHIACEKYENIKDEVYYNHNVPTLILAKNKELIEYYLSVECTCCEFYCSKEMIKSYDSAWQLIRKQFCCQ